VSDDELEDDMPDITDFLSFPHASETGIGHSPSADPPHSCLPTESDIHHPGPSRPSTMLAPQNPGTATSHVHPQNPGTMAPHIPPVLPSPHTDDLNWANILANVQYLLVPNPVALAVMKLGMNWEAHPGTSLPGCRCEEK